MRPTIVNYGCEKVGHCSICGLAYVEGKCPAYHWHDQKHLENRERIEQGLPPIPIEPVNLDEKRDWGPCWQCGATTDPEGRCTRENEFSHFQNFSKWMDLFHSRAESQKAPPVTFLIDGFLQREGVTAIAAPVRERKSLIALNIAHALVTGEKLFDKFAVVKRPRNVLYLCPEVSLGPFTDRINKIGLQSYVCNGFFYRTLSKDGQLSLRSEHLLDAVYNSVVFLDTAIRFIEGDENSSKDVRAFADDIFRLLKYGAEAVVLLHHSPKDMGDHMTLESAMRGSGDMGAFLASCWGTRLQDPADPYKSKSFLSNLKQRDFESADFEVTVTEDCRMHYVDPGLVVPTLKNRRGNMGNKDGLDGKALDFIRENRKLSLRDISKGLIERGIRRGKDWVREKKHEVTQENGGALSSE